MAKTLGMVGCGTMGRGIAQVAAQAGMRVLMFDARERGAAEGREAVTKMLARLTDKGKLTPPDAAAAGDRLVVVEALGSLAECDVVIEAIVEELAAKRALLATLESIVGSECILATNTSSLSVTAIAAGLQRPGRVAGFHFFNPVPVLKVVEVVAGLQSEGAVVDALVELARAWGHTPVRAKDTPGFIVNHAGRGFGSEGLRILSEGVTDVAGLDRVLRDTAGFKLGPGELLDLTGIDVSHPVMESIYHQYYEEPRFRPQPLTRQMLAAGLLGRKTGRGFYSYSQGKPEPPPEPEAPARRPETVWVSPARPDLKERATALIRALGGRIDAGESPAPASLCLVTPVGEDATTLAARQSLDPARTAATDLLFDTSRRRVVMTTPATHPAMRDAAAGLFSADGVPVTVIHDSTGVIAQRVVATIVNIACDIAQQRIATPEDIDRAVVMGLAYPHGPLAWGDRLGAGVVLEILSNIFSLTGDPRYRPSPWLRRRAQLGLSLLSAEA